MIRKLLTAALLCSASLPALGQDPQGEKWVEVEVLVFEQPAIPGDKESWPEAATAPAAGNAIDILAPEVLEESVVAETAATPPASETAVPSPAAGSAATNPPPASADAPEPAPQEPAYRALPPSELRLADAKTRLAQAGHRPLVHLAWRQPLGPASQTVPLRITGGDSYAQPAPAEAQPVDAAPAAAMNPPPGEALPESPVETLPPQEPSVTVPPEAALAAPEPTPAAPPLWQIEGLLRLSAAPQAEFDAELVLRKPAEAPPAGSDLAAGAPAFRLLALPFHQRLTPGDIHYLDHPLLGILVQLRPYAPPVPPGEGGPLEPPAASAPAR